jgi:uncharacterized membrane protein YhaH (DUF805 family)
MEYMLMSLRRYADFSGRSRRMEYWMFVLFYTVLLIGVMIVGFVLDAVLGLEEPGLPFGSATIILLGITMLGLIIPSIAVQVRRFHDQDKSGWFVLLGLIPYAGGLILLIFMCIDGTAGSNRFGEDPQGRGTADTFA